MRLIEFSYTLYKGLSVPIIPVQLQSQGEWFDLWAFVDSGATYSIFTMRDAAGMGLNLGQAVQRFIVVGDGSFIRMFVQKVPVKIGHVWINTTIGFSAQLGADINLLGHTDIFDRCIITFNRPQGIVTFKLHK